MTTLAQYERAPTRRDIRRFYSSAEWRNQKGAALYVKGRRCARCGMTDGPFHVDHIIPVRISWAARLSMWNLQVLCETHHSSDKKREENAKWR